MTTAPATPRKLTVEDLLAMPDGDQFELVDGVLTEKCMGVYANETSIVAAAVFAGHQRRFGGRFLGEQQYAIFQDEHITKRPDISYFRPGRVPARGLRILRVAPDLVVEIVSPTNSTVEGRLAIEAWLNAGVGTVWVLLPELREVTVYRRGERPEVFTAADIITGGGALPGFSAPVADLFPEPEA